MLFDTLQQLDAGLRLQALQTGRRTLVMGILNVTPDSFSDGGQFLALDAAIAQAERMAEEGADIIDVGGESTRPATWATQAPLAVEDEIRRVAPVIEEISRRLPHLPISIDTFKAEAARGAVGAGASLINDISGGRADPAMLPFAAEASVPICLMHMPGLPAAVPTAPEYTDVVAQVRAHLESRAQAALDAGVAPSHILIDPGIGFGKSARNNLEILRRLSELTSLPYPLLIGTSRKSTIGKVLGGLGPEDRVEGTAATVTLAIAAGAAIVRVHDVRAMARVARMSDAIVRGWPLSGEKSTDLD